MNDTEILIAISLLGLAIWLLSYRWTWIAIGCISFVTALFSMFASIIHFQILHAVGFAALCVFIMWCIGRMMEFFDKRELG